MLTHSDFFYLGSDWGPVLVLGLQYRVSLYQLSYIPNPRFEEEEEVVGSSALCLVHLGSCGHS